MKVEEFSGNPGLNDCIAACLWHLEAGDAARIARKLRSNAGAPDKREFLHTFRELILGAYLAHNGFRVRTFEKHDGKDPDWSIVDDGGTLRALIEVRSFHADQQTESRIDAALAAGQWAYAEFDEAKTSQRFLQTIWEKCGAYKDLAKAKDVPYVIGCFGYFSNWLERSTVLENLHSPEFGLFRRPEDDGYPDVSGLVVFDERTSLCARDAVAHAYVFEYFSNPHATRPFEIPAGSLYSPMSIKRKEHFLLQARHDAGQIGDIELMAAVAWLAARDPSVKVMAFAQKGTPTVPETRS
jgi:hypothetical protein